jgi:hypothetical protein
LELVAATPRGEQGFGGLGRPDDPVDVHLKRMLVPVGQLAERILVASACTREGMVGHTGILLQTFLSRARG